MVTARSKFSKAFCIGSVLAAAVFASACNEATKPMNEDEYCAEYGKRECEKIRAQCSFKDINTCFTTRAANCKESVVKAKAQGRAFRPENVEPCLNQVSDVFSKPNIGTKDLQDLERTCGRVFLGTGKRSEACATDQDCVPGLICDRAKRKCGENLPVGPNAECANTGNTCPETQYCRKKADTWECGMRLDPGAECADNGACLPSLRCSQGKCAARLSNQETCASNDDCSGGICLLFLNPPLCAESLSFALQSPSCRAYEGTLTSGGSSPAPTMPAGDAGAKD